MLWSWVIGSDEVDPASIDEVTTRIAAGSACAPSCASTTRRMHRAAFALPTFVQTLLQLTERDEPPTVADLRAAGHPLPGVIA